MYQIKIGDQTFDLSCVTVDRDSCIIQFPDKYTEKDIQTAFSSELDFTVVMDIKSTAETGEDTIQTAEYPYTGYAHAGDPEIVTVNDAQRVQIILYQRQAENPEQNQDELLRKIADLEESLNILMGGSNV